MLASALNRIQIFLMKHISHILLFSLISCASTVSHASSSGELQSSQAIPEKTDFLARSQLQWVTFTDLKGRHLVAEIVEVKEDAVRIRRKLDEVEMDLPVHLLCAADQAFFKYLKDPKPRDDFKASDIMDNLFKNSQVGG